MLMFNQQVVKKRSRLIDKRGFYELDSHTVLTTFCVFSSRTHQMELFLSPLIHFTCPSDKETIENECKETVPQKEVKVTGHIFYPIQSRPVR